MKTTFSLIISCMLFLSSCSTSRTTSQTSSPQDDVYYSSKDKSTKQVVQETYQNTQKDTRPAPVVDENQYSGSGDRKSDDTPVDENSYTNSQTNANDTQNQDSYSSGGSTYITNNYYDDSYDYNYSSRIRRFHSHCYNWSYYDDYYTNMYWYDYNPYSWGTSIYIGYHWWGPSFYYSSTPFYYGYYGYSNYGYNSYSSGYWNGYQQGWYNSNYDNHSQPYYYNSRDNNSVYVAPRGGTGSNHKVFTRNDNELLSNKYTLANASVLVNRPRSSSGAVRNNILNGKHLEENESKSLVNSSKDIRDKGSINSTSPIPRDAAKGNLTKPVQDSRNYNGNAQESSPRNNQFQQVTKDSRNAELDKSLNSQQSRPIPSREDHRQTIQNSNQVQTPRIHFEERPSSNYNENNGRQEPRMQSRPSENRGNGAGPSQHAPIHFSAPANSGGSRSTPSTGNGGRSSSRGR